MTCLFTAVSRSPCQLTDLQCTCTDAPLLSAVESCVLQSCTVVESLKTKNITSTLCGVPVRSRSGQLKAISISLAVISNLSFAARLIGKFTRLNQAYGFGIDDVCLTVVVYVGMSNAIMIDRGTLRSGLGRDVWTLDIQTITDFVRYFYVMEILYFVEITFLKLSLLFFFLRIFTSVRTKQLLWGTIAFNVAFGIAFIFAGIFQCQPISHYWTYWTQEDSNGHCISVNGLAWANAAINIAVDLWMLALPLYEVSKLNMALKKKIAVSLMFGVGTFVTVLSILRLQSLVHFANSVNPTWDQWDVTLWSIVEINVGIICACMPTFRTLLAHVLPRVFGSTSGSSHPRQTDNKARASFRDAREKASVFFNSSSNGGSDSTSPTRSTGSRGGTQSMQDDEIELVGVQELDVKGDRAHM